MMNSVSCNQSKINFTANPERVAWRALHGIPNKLNSAYIGYTGPKNFHFPTSPDLEKHLYPDITENYQKLLGQALETINKKLGKNKIVNFFKKCILLCKNGKTADKWDTKFLEDFPGRTKDGKVQYALFKDKVVSANYVSNYIYSEMLHKLNFKKKTAIAAAKIYSNGFSNLFFDKKFTSFKDLCAGDCPKDQATIRQAFDEFNKIRAHSNKENVSVIRVA